MYSGTISSSGMEAHPKGVSGRCSLEAIASAGDATAAATAAVGAATGAAGAAGNALLSSPKVAFSPRVATGDTVDVVDDCLLSGPWPSLLFVEGLWVS